MTQTSQENGASNLPTERSVNQPIEQSIQPVPVGEIIQNLSLSHVMITLKTLMSHTGIVKLDTPHLSWEIFIHSGSIAFIEDKSDFLSTITRKLKIQKIQIPPDFLRSLSKKAMSGLETYQWLGKIYAQDRENCLVIFKEILLENLLAISLEKKFSLQWQPLNLDRQIILPIWQLPDLEKAIAKVIDQWQTFNHVRHPYQTVQILDTECKIAQVPLFTQVTNGKCRITEIADRFQQHITRTALKLDKLAENRTVAILPLPLRSAEASLNLEENKEAESRLRVMIVDDSPVLLKQFGNLLTSWGYHLILVSDSAKATQQILSDKPDIVFMDINMPNLNGFELIKQIRRQPSLATMPLVLVTSENTITNNFRAKWANCRFLSKPRSSNDIPEFREQVKSILQDFIV
ncbi:response regulator [Pseudanabaena sp. UWO310]|uniref:response regulator n=1 Tax=Pseudanabaena sp. UWO310 TaxID=2480795 RepID=UPI001159E72F|nr:response regulator [Pseudanabaena sp. UWO310]TYQ31577.1 response regulator [Pseudanabaena sp. UWO310]